MKEFEELIFIKKIVDKQCEDIFIEICTDIEYKELYYFHTIGSTRVDFSDRFLVDYSWFYDKQSQIEIQMLEVQFKRRRNLNNLLE